MTFSLGIDLGTTTCTVARRVGPAIDVCPLEPGAVALPAVALTDADGTLVVGREADRRCPYEPPLVARYLQGRLDEPGPVDVDGHPVDPRRLTASLLRAAAGRAAPRPGAPADQVVVTFPLGPGPAPEALMRAAAIDALGPDTVLVPAPVAALARAAAAHGLRDDARVAVVDVGGATVDVALLQRAPAAFDLVGEPATLADLGGVDLDAAVLALVDGVAGDVTSTVAPGDRAGRFALRRLRAACRTAKERLSTEHTAIVEVDLPQLRGAVEVTRAAYERTIEPALVEIADLVATTVDAGGLTLADLEGIVLVGGSARTPRLIEVLAGHLGRPVLCDDEPAATVALGAAMFAAPVPAAARPAAPSSDPRAATAPGPPDPFTRAGPAARRPDPWDDTDPGKAAVPVPWSTAPAPPADPAAPADPWGRTSDAQVRRLTTSDTDPFGQRSTGGLASLRRERRATDDDIDDTGAVDRRLVLGGIAAAVLVLVAGCWLAFLGMGGDSTTRITVADANNLRSTTSSTAEPTTTATTDVSTTTSPSTTEAPTTTTGSEPTSPPAAAPAPQPPPAAPPPTAPPSTTPPTTRPPTTTTTTVPTTTTSTTNTSTTGPPGQGNGGGPGKGG